LLSYQQKIIGCKEKTYSVNSRIDVMRCRQVNHKDFRNGYPGRKRPETIIWSLWPMCWFM